MEVSERLQDYHSTEGINDPEGRNAGDNADHQGGSGQFQAGPGQDRSERNSAAQQKETLLFNRFLAGHDESYRILYDLYERPVFLYIVRLVGGEAEAQDVFQDVWVRMYKLRGERETVTKFSGLLFTIARNLSLNAIRDRKHLPDVSLEDVPPDMESQLQAMNFDEADIREMLQKALAQLPEVQREAFILREYNGYSYQEIADITGATMINVKTRAWRARERLRRMISAWMELRASE